MADKKIIETEIIGGPDRFELLAKFGIREPVKFQVEHKGQKEEVEVILNSIGHEDGSGFSFLLEKGYTADHKTIEKGWYRSSDKTGYLHLSKTE